MAENNRYKNQQNRPSPDDPDFDLDSYLNERVGQIPPDERHEQRPNNPNKGRNRLLIGGVVIIALLAFNPLQRADNILRNNIGGVFGDLLGYNDNAVTVVAPPAPPVVLPPVPTVQGYQNLSYADYLERIREAGLQDEISSTATQSFYDNNIPVEYLTQLNDAEFLDTFSYSGIIALYNSGVPVSFLQDLDNRGLLNDMSYSDVIVAYNS